MDWKKFFEKDCFALHSGVVLEEVSPGNARASVLTQPHHLNAGGVVQGGVLFTLADFCMAAAANAHGVLAFSIQADIRYLQSAKVGEKLTAIADEVLLKRSIAHYRVNITNDMGDLVAVFDGICHRKQ